jgi:hypothetical protein
LRGCSVREQKPGQMRGPVGGVTSGAECGFEGAVETFHHTVGLGVVGRRGDVGDVEDVGKLGPDC